MTTDKARTKHLKELHFDHRLWMLSANFYADELSVYQKRLEEIAGKNSGIEVRKGIEQFQNRFKIQKEQLDTLKHEITIHEQWLSTYANEHPVAIDHKFFADHRLMREKNEMFDKIYTDLKHEFNEFIAKWL